MQSFYFPQSEHNLLSEVICTFTNLCDVHENDSKIMQIIGDIYINDIVLYELRIKDWQSFMLAIRDSTMTDVSKSKFFALLLKNV